VVTRLLLRLSGLYSPDVLTTAYRWEKPVDALDGKDIVLFASYAPAGALRPYTQAYVSAFRDEGFFVVLILIADDPNVVVNHSACGGADAILVRGNAGFDFAAWATALRLLPSLWNARMIVLANDSVFGPFSGFSSLVRRLRHSVGDIVGLTESAQIRRHLQSYFFAMKTGALRSERIRHFWKRVRNLPSKRAVINAYEVQFLAYAERAGLRSEALFPLQLPRRRSRRAKSPTHDYWRKLIATGFPFMKVDLLRDTPVDTTGWPKFLREHGVDIDPIVKHLLTVAPNSEALVALKGLDANREVDHGTRAG